MGLTAKDRKAMKDAEKAKLNNSSEEEVQPAAPKSNKKTVARTTGEDDPAMQAPVVRAGRDYAKGTVTLAENVKNNPIPVPDFSPDETEIKTLKPEVVAENIPVTGEPTEKPNRPSSSSGPSKSTEKILTKDDIIDTSDLKKKDQKKQAKALAKTVLDGYQFLCDAGYMVWNYDEDKCNRLAVKGKIDPAIFGLAIPYDEAGHTKRLGEFLSDYNQKLKDTLTVDQTFRSAALPLLSEIFEREEMGLSPEWELATLFIMDITQKVMGITQLHGSMNVIMKSLTAQVRNDRSRGKHVEPAEIPNIPKPQPQQEQEEEEPARDIDVETEMQDAVEVKDDQLNSSTLQRVTDYVMPETEQIVQSEIDNNTPGDTKLQRKE